MIIGTGYFMGIVKCDEKQAICSHSSSNNNSYFANVTVTHSWMTRVGMFSFAITPFIQILYVKVSHRGLPIQPIV